MKVVILAGGQGTRMGGLTKDIPKPMVPLAGKPILEHQLNLLSRYNLTDITILVGYKSEIIKNYFKDGVNWGVNIDYYQDPKPLGTSGSLKEIQNDISAPFLLMYGDTILDIHLKDLINFHHKKKSIASLVVHPNDHPEDSDLIEIDKKGNVINFFSKPHKKNIYFRNLVNAALYVLDPEVFNFIRKGIFSDFGKDIFPKVLSSGKGISAYNTTEYIKDIGTPQRLKEVENDFFSGKIKKSNKVYKQKAIFLDRDGVINVESDPIDTVEKFKLLPRVSEALKKINKSVYLNVIITNQPIVAKGFITEKELTTIHNYMEHIIGYDGAYFNRIYYCPHHPKKGFKDEVKKYKISCNCRKPGTKLLKTAEKEMNIDLKHSFFIGDRTVDIKTGNNANMQTILVRQGFKGLDKKYECKPDFIFDDLYDATKFILNDYQKILSKIESYFKDNLDKSENLFISVGGLSRSGKSTFSTILKKYFMDLKIEVEIIQLDKWILPLKKRDQSQNVRNRYQYDRLNKDIKKLLSGEEVILNEYSSFDRSDNQFKSLISWNESQVTIIEGVIALDSHYIRRISNHSFFIRINEEERKNRFESFYIEKGLKKKEIVQVYQKRNYDEVPVIDRSAKFANIIINMDSL